jgi:hypothetical protein
MLIAPPSLTVIGRIALAIRTPIALPHTFRQETCRGPPKPTPTPVHREVAKSIQQTRRVGWGESSV